jgi:hypothetical protein
VGMVHDTVRDRSQEVSFPKAASVRSDHDEFSTRMNPPFRL